jgi:nucleotide-binding universal stress UspA family protein
VYKHILVAIEHTPADETIVAHVEELARLAGSRLLLVHVADGWAARNFDELQLRESEEMRDDRAYLEQLENDLLAKGFEVESILGLGDPAHEICRIACDRGVDLIAMATHGHRGVSDMIHGQTVDHVRHRVPMPVLLLRAKRTK